MGMAPPPVMNGGSGAPPQGPPPAFGNPSLANIPQGQPPGPPHGQSPMEAGGALPRLVFQIEQSIETLGRSLPSNASEKLNSIREQLREVIAEALSGGGPQMGGGNGGPF